MIVTVCSFKGGTGKTTSAVHVAAHFSRSGPTLLVDADANRSALVWARHSRLPFTVVDERQAARSVRDLQPHHTVIDTAARPDPEVIETLARGCDFLIVPTTPDALSIAALVPITEAIQKLGAHQWRVLLTMVPPLPNADGNTARQELVSAGLPLFRTAISRTVAFPRAALKGVLVDDLPPRLGARAAAQYREAAQEIPV
jgi:chromosome partitioning protein